MYSNLIKNTFALALLAASVGNAMAADSVDVKVIGSIIPAACTPTISGGGVIDYGNIKASTLSADNYTALPEMQLNFSLVCDAPAKVALKAINGRPGTMAGVTETAFNTGSVPVAIYGNASNAASGVGLNLDGTAKIGGYGVRIAAESSMADGIPVDTIGQENGYSTSGSYTKIPDGAVYGAGGRIITWATPGSLTPVAFKVLSGKLGVQAYINKASALDLTHVIHLDGLTTLEVVYL
ncbi:DUF1120 domain-containing protein [Buttiauxella sp. B2]|uniref:DUF1120 domain-containing protein n=1 Tax=Buttiauxella sp. B2 TaxID=2587812 RepID=UPI00112418DE|nr:DUF1120 domain-containing protein [Buttiauxella sp. B2]TNV09877.1 DUF1120 domain-containing protein [Buttiauxella sp. B2]